MIRYNGVAITDGTNRKNHILPLKTLISSYHKAWKNPIPMNLGHDRCKPIGVTELTGIYLEPGKAYLTNISKITDSPKEMEDMSN